MAIMPKRLTRQRRDEIRDEIRAKAEHPGQAPPEELAMKLLKCGHEEMVSPALSAELAVCSQCRQKSLLSRA